MKTKEYSVEIGGRTMTAIFSDLADQAHGAVMLKYGETIVLATAVMTHDKQQGLGFFNLTVDYVEKFYAAGKILGSRFTRREGKPSDDAIISSRVIDRTVRPLFDKHIRHGVQLIVTVLSVDDNDPTMIAINAASLALGVSNIPWNGPVGAVRIGKPAGEIIINPSFTIKETSKTDFDLMICGKAGNINMIEAGAFQVPEAEIVEAFTIAQKEITKLEDFQKKIISELGQPKRVVEKTPILEKSIELFKQTILPVIETKLFDGKDPETAPGVPSVMGKHKIDELHTLWNNTVKAAYPDREDFEAEDDYFDEYVNDLLHIKAIKENMRADGRKMDELRKIFAKAGGLSSIIHGSGVFYRGATHVLSVLTLGGPEDAHFTNGMEINEEKRFMHHYNFPPFSVGETGRATQTGRREIGHGALAEKALFAVLPSKEEFPYTIRLVSEALASNGSTSMASTCGGCIALMDGGVPIKAPVAGVAMGLMLEQKQKNTESTEALKYKILTDIQGPEDHHGDMDFKVTGTRTGVTAIQLDVKVDGVPIKILAEAMEQSKKARLEILDVIERELPAPRKEISSNAPKILTTTIKVSQIGLLIGPGGKNIKGIKDKTGAEINVEDDGTVYCVGKNGSAEAAMQMVKDLTHEYLPGELTKGEVVKLMDFGAFIKLNPTTDGLVHISEIAPWRVERVTDILKEGMIVPVKIKELDDRGRLSLSIKLADPNFFKKP
ncbi:MAG: Polyribonucleotide nucleotidyltransferase [Candidatus Nomurabacteria bacterium GW2011_GWB1_37_5]|uniref:Polyribonucleotide nucleotidyltransferase n=1 Tax=Candidatus Nomurabacteria bacterium GW2011_GWB1_37_5 TaxID=1618742 RepID=A0A0G0GUY4_9BACT|nr:MAG: Polyribonucleotide nucleotidyltransferase [Candidatus Nomurabacteria bacterium GW2011_GWB1_37_5]